MSKPVRIQRSRAKGSKVESPNGLENVYIGRTGREDFKGCGNILANPYIVGKPIDEKLRPWTKISDFNNFESKPIDLKNSLKMYADYLELQRKFFSKEFEAIRQKVSGKNVVCWCKLDQQCHGDILLKLFND